MIAVVVSPPGKRRAALKVVSISPPEKRAASEKGCVD
jgi:hypothetical protein